MNRQQTVSAIAHRLRHLKQRDVNEVLTVLLELWGEELVQPDGYIRIEGLGKLYVEPQTLRSGGVVFDTLKQQQNPPPATLTRYYFRFQPAKSLRAKLIAARSSRQEGA